jgi:serine/threonine protein kinase/tetratricopeptide (TPR) repeat protein
MAEQFFGHALPGGYQLDQFVIEQVLGAGGFGIVYRARHSNPGISMQVAIKEYLPSSLAHRTQLTRVVPTTADRAQDYQFGLRKFIAEADILLRLSERYHHRSLIQVRHFFEANGTAYMVMNYEDAESLSDVLKREPVIPWERLKPLALSVLDGLEIAHREQVIHRDIKPANILIRKDGTPVLIDFGAARQEAGAVTLSGMGFFSPPYSAFEQYVPIEKVGPRTDLYAFGVVLYRAVTGVESADIPIPLVRREGGYLKPAREAAAGLYPPSFLDAIDRCLEVEPKGRPEDAAALQRLIEADEAPAGPAPVAEGSAASATAAPVSEPITGPEAVPPPAPEPPPADPPAADSDRADERVTMISERSWRQDPEPREKKTGLVAGLAVGGALAVASIVAGAWYFLQTDGEDDPSPPMTAETGPSEALPAGDAQPQDFAGPAPDSPFAPLEEPPAAEEDPEAVEEQQAARQRWNDLQEAREQAAAEEERAREKAREVASAPAEPPAPRPAPAPSAPQASRPDRPAPEPTAPQVTTEAGDLLAAGKSAYDSGNYRTAAKLYGDAVAERPDSYAAHFALGRALEADGRPKEAADSFQQALELKPDIPYNLYYVANFYEGQKEYSQADALYSRYLEQRPNDADMWRKRAQLRQKMGKTDLAVADIDKALELKPNDNALLMERGDLYSAAGDMGNAIASYSRLIDAGTKDAGLFYRRGAIYHKMQKTQEALADYERALQVDPDFMQALWASAAINLFIGQPQKAVDVLNRAIALSPDNAGLYSQRGWGYYALRQYDPAARDFNKALELKPSLADAKRGLATVQKVQGGG